VAREAFFECTLASKRRTTLVLAWSATEAKLEFKDLLAVEGVRRPGPILVKSLSERSASPKPGPKVKRSRRGAARST
jgi:hypothetical protein